MWQVSEKFSPLSLKAKQNNNKQTKHMGLSVTAPGGKTETIIIWHLKESDENNWRLQFHNPESLYV